MSKVLIVGMVLVAAIYLIPALSQAANCTQGVVACMSDATYKTCSRAVNCTGQVYIKTTNPNPPNVTSFYPAATWFGTSPMLTISAKARRTAPTPRTVNWQWHTSGYTQTGMLSITTADGLPVELMDFSVE